MSGLPLYARERLNERGGGRAVSNFLGRDAYLNDSALPIPGLDSSCLVFQLPKDIKAHVYGGREDSTRSVSLLLGARGKDVHRGALRRTDLYFPRFGCHGGEYIGEQKNHRASEYTPTPVKRQFTSFELTNLLLSSVDSISMTEAAESRAKPP